MYTAAVYRCRGCREYGALRQGVKAVEGCRARTQCEERCVKMVNICVLHFTIGSQTPPNNTRHIMGTHIHHLAIRD